MQNYSVLMSVYYKEKAEYLELAIESMLKQTVPPEQFVIVEDGKLTEELEQVIIRYEKQDPNLFTIVRLDENRGLGLALNEGMKHCRNELVARMDSDDISLPERCEKILKEFVNDKQLVICGCNIDEFYGEISNLRTSRVVPREHNDIKKFMKKRQAFNHPTVIYKKSKVIEAGGYIILRRKEDFDLFSRMISLGYNTKNVPESLYLYRADDMNYLRRKNFINFRSAVYVYWRHFLRGTCGLIDFVMICSGEFLFLVLPIPLMKKISDNVLRKGVKAQNNER